GSGRINSTTGYHLQWPKKNSTHCPGWVDHYNLLLNYVYVTISSSKKDCSYIIYKFSLLVFPRAVLFGGFLRGRFLLGR
ncbi:hypothetical protein ACS5RY_24995, partial [Pseudomonas aeruginosa]|uniref:hypothetical protein n=1 Tax=Pseudomonas aeruginosa TaxID=287 RepID=UPI003FA48D88